jgi:hypothetical protein
MTRQIAHAAPDVPLAVLEERLHVLEGRLGAVAEAIHVLTHGLENLPTAGPAAEAARRAHELLLLAQPQIAGSPVGGAAEEEP